jgi:hypothetical protein
MKLLIGIPKEFEQHFKQDAFEDSLHRLSADAHLLAGNYEQETAVMLIEAFASAIPVPPHKRLIDADELYHQMAQLDSSWEYGQGVADCFKLLENAPTIVSADYSI